MRALRRMAAGPAAVAAAAAVTLGRRTADPAASVILSAIPPSRSPRRSPSDARRSQAAASDHASAARAGARRLSFGARVRRASTQHRHQGRAGRPARASARPRRRRSSTTARRTARSSRSSDLKDVKGIGAKRFEKLQARTHRRRLRQPSRPPRTGRLGAGAGEAAARSLPPVARSAMLRHEAGRKTGDVPPACRRGRGAPGAQRSSAFARTLIDRKAIIRVNAVASVAAFCRLPARYPAHGAAHPRRRNIAETLHETVPAAGRRPPASRGWRSRPSTSTRPPRKSSRR